MAIELRLSTKVDKGTGMQELLVRFFHGRNLNLRAKTGIYINQEL